VSPVRPAAENDIAELVRLRALLSEALGSDFFNPPSSDNSWRDTCTAVLKKQLQTDTTRILVVDGDDSIAACGYGTIEQWIPGPHVPNGKIGHVIGVVTDPAYRRRGYSRAITQGLLDWFRGRDVALVHLHASVDSEPLYRSLGFTDNPDPSLSWRLS
jgi:ribosomal protein S18 acetylase RimI-like enzyme